MSYQIFSLGSLVTLKESFLDEPVGTIAYVYETYGAGGISIITQNGEDLGGFSYEEQREFLDYYGDTGQCYQFKNVMRLDDDWNKGVFDFWSKNPEQYKRKLKIDGK